MRVLVGVLGLVLGILAGACLVLANPLAWFQAALPPLSAESAPAKAYRWENSRGIKAGVADLLGVGRPERGVALMDPALRHIRVGIVVFPAGEGTSAALAVKMSSVAEENSLLRAQLGTHDYWNIFWPGEGSIFASGYSNFWGFIRSSFFSAAQAEGPQSMAAYPVSAPSPGGDSAAITGAAGRYARVTGEIRDGLFTAPPDSAADYLDWELALKVTPPTVTKR